MKALYNVINEKRKYSDICEYIEGRYPLMQVESNQDVYAPSNKKTYELEAGFILTTESSFDVFGSSKTGGYYVCIENIDSSDYNYFTVFAHNVTIIDGKKVEDNIEICEYDDLMYIVNNHSFIEYNEEYFLKHLNNNTSKLELVWEKTPNDVKEKYLPEFMEYIYEKATEKLEKIREYDRYSPYGGEDISYFPESYGECFSDMIRNYLPVSLKNVEEIIMSFISSKDANDSYVRTYQYIKNVANDDLVEDKLKGYYKDLIILNDAERMLELYEIDYKDMEETYSKLKKDIIFLWNKKFKTKKVRHKIDCLFESQADVHIEMFDLQIAINSYKNKIYNIENKTDKSELSKLSSLFFDVMGYKDIYSEYDIINGSLVIDDHNYYVFKKRLKEKIII